MKKYLVLFISLLLTAFVFGQDYKDIATASDKAKKAASGDSTKSWHITGKKNGTPPYWLTSNPNSQTGTNILTTVR